MIHIASFIESQHLKIFTLNFQSNYKLCYTTKKKIIILRKLKLLQHIQKIFLKIYKINANNNIILRISREKELNLHNKICCEYNSELTIE